MVAERWQGDVAEAAVLERGGVAWERLQERIAHHFGRVEARARVRRVLAGLLRHRQCPTHRHASRSRLCRPSSETQPPLWRVPSV
jgi:hypothetical protein